MAIAKYCAAMEDLACGRRKRGILGLSSNTFLRRRFCDRLFSVIFSDLDQLVAELLGSSVQMRECAVEAALLVDLHILFHIFLAPGDHQVDQAGMRERPGDLGPAPSVDERQVAGKRHAFQRVEQGPGDRDERAVGRANVPLHDDTRIEWPTPRHRRRHEPRHRVGSSSFRRAPSPASSCNRAISLERCISSARVSISTSRSGSATGQVAPCTPRSFAVAEEGMPEACSAASTAASSRAAARVITAPLSCAPARHPRAPRSLTS